MNKNRQTQFHGSCILFIVIFLMATTLTVFGAPNSTTKVVLATGEWDPYTGEKIEGNGFFTELVTAVFKEIGLEPQYLFYPWERCESSVKKDEAWAAFPYAYTSERAKLYLYSDTVAYAYT